MPPAKKPPAKKAAPPQATRTRKERKFPALTFPEAVKLADGIQKFASGQKVRRLVLFESLKEEPDSLGSRKLITASGQYGLTKGSYQAEFLELTVEGNEATNEETPRGKRLQARFNLSIKKHAPFEFLYGKLKGNKVPVKEVMADNLKDQGLEQDEVAECIDTFILNAKDLGLLRMIGGSERLVPIEQVIEEAGQGAVAGTDGAANGTCQRPPSNENGSGSTSSSSQESNGGTEDFSKICFYITPIGKDDSVERRHFDFMMEYIIGPAVKEFNLTVVRADKIGKPGMIGKQVIEHILKARLVIADLSFHNPNVFYELCLRHTTRLPTVQVRREEDSIPFDVNQYRTIGIETKEVYTVVPKLQTYTSEVATQVRRALEDADLTNNPISLFYPAAKLSF